MTPSKFQAPPKSINADWTPLVDRFLAKIEGMTSGEAAARFGLGAAAVTAWRVKRRRGDPVLGLRAKYHEPLLRALETEGPTDTIPIHGLVSLRQRPPRFRDAS